MVYYFIREPKAFFGGRLRLFPIGPQTVKYGESIDIDIVQDRAIAFPSWLPHAVLPVHCPSGDFADSRFAVNCWLLKDR
jgi:Rps23 Pro-64 3,4-dihydroxylase Tpa1-like proline 4-hydroxylase